MSETLTVNAKNWHNKRYTKDEIKKIQSALNKQALGKLIAVDGIFGSETLNAGYMPTMHAVTPQRSVVIQEVPDYDRGITYAPWLGYNTVPARRKGGLVSKGVKNKH